MGKKFEESLIHTVAMRSHVSRDLHKLFDHIVHLAKHSHSVGYYKRAGRELAQARRLAKLSGNTGDVYTVHPEPFADVWGSEGIMGAYELPEMSERIGGPYELPLIGGCCAPRSVAGAAWGRAAPRRPVMRRGRPARTALAHVSYAIECIGYEAAAEALEAHTGAMLAGWPAGTEHHWIIGAASLERSGDIYKDIENWDAEMRAIITRMGGKMTPPLVTELSHAFGEIQRFAKSPSAWITVQNAHGVGRAVARKALGGRALTPAEDKLVTDQFVKVSRAMPGSSNFLKTISNAVSSTVSQVGNTVTSAAKTLVDGVKKYNPVALAKVAAVKAKALAGDIANSVIFKTLGAVASAALAPALAVIKTVGPVLPYVKTVLSFVPGVGTGISAALGAAQALADGRRIDEAIVAAAKSAIPGGPIAQMGFDAAWGLANGRPIDTVVLGALRDKLPNDLAKRAFDTGLALATAKSAQDRRDALKTAAMGAIASNVPIPIPGAAKTVIQAAQNVQRAAQPYVQAAQNTQRIVQQTANTVAQVAKAAQAMRTTPQQAALMAANFPGS